MDSKNEDKMKGKANQAAGAVRGKAGEMTDNEEMEAKGKNQEMKGRGQEAKGDIKDAADKVGDAAKSAFGR